MIFLQLWWALMVFSSPGHAQQLSIEEQKQPAEGSDKLLSFSRAVELARPELQELKASYGGGQEQDASKQLDRRNSIDNMLASFAQTDADKSKAASAEEERVMQEAADAWFRDIQASMSKINPYQKRSGGKQERSIGKHMIDQHAKALERTEMGKVKLKYKQLGDDTIVRKYQVTKNPLLSQDTGMTQLDIKLKQVQQMLTDQESLEAKKLEKAKEGRKKVDESSWVDKLPEFGDNPIPDGIYESTLNRLAFPHAMSHKLAHEANYKLSKIEQEASEKASSKHSRPGSLSEGPLKQQKRSSCSGFNPMNEIKLKTSSRLMLKGLGPSLPSNALLDIHRNHLVDNMIRRRELEEQQQQQHHQQQQLESSEDSDEVDQRMGINNLMAHNEHLEYLQPISSGMDANRMMELPQSYDYRVPQYDRFHPLNQRQMSNVRDYERSNRMPLDLDRFKREPHLASSSLEPSIESILDPISVEEPLLKAEDQNISDHELAMKMGVLDINEGKALHSTDDGESKEKDTHEEVKLDEESLVKPGSKLDSEITSIEGKFEDRSEVEVENKLLGPVKREATKELTNQVGPKLKYDESALDANSNAKADVPLTLARKSELNVSAHADLSSDSGKQDSLKKRKSPETADCPDSHDSNPDCDTECKSQTDAEKDDSIVKVNIKLKLQEPPELQADEKSECEDICKVEAKGAAASAPKVNPDAVVKLLANELSLDKDRGKRQTRRRRFPRQNRRSKRSLEDNEPAQQQQEPEDKQHVVTKRLAPLLDDFEDHNGNHAGFGNLGNGMLTPDAEDSGERSYPSHELLAHFDELETAHDGDSLGAIFDPTKEVVPMLNKRPNDGFQGQQPMQMQFPQQQQMQQPQQVQQQVPQPQQHDLNRQRHQSSNFQASFNLTHLFNELQKLQNMKTPQQQQPQQQQQPVQQQQQQPVQQQFMPQQQPLPQQFQLPQQQMPVQRNMQQLPNKPISPPIKSFGVHRYFGPFFNKQLKHEPYMAAMETSTTMDPRCVSITATSPTPAGNVTMPFTLPANCTTATVPTTPVPSTPATPATPATPGTPSANQSSHTEIGCNAADAMKFNVSINANVFGDPKTKQFCGNGSISLLPAYNALHSELNRGYQNDQLHGNAAELEDDLDDLKVKDERRVRDVGEEAGDEWQPKAAKEKPRKQEGQIKRPSIKWNKKHRNRHQGAKAKIKGVSSADHNEASKEATKGAAKETPTGAANEGHKASGKCYRPRIEIPESQSESYDKLITGKISEDIVSAVFEAVGNDPGMDRLLAVLERNRKCANKQAKNFYQIRNDKTESYLHHTETMVRETMEAISNIIDQQVRRRACIPLRPDLQDFYDLILKTSNEERKCREKRQSSLQILAEDFSQDVRLLDPSKISQKSRIVKKLLRQYEDLPMEDQQAAVGVRDELLLDLVYLRKMAESAERCQRNARLQEVLKQTSLDEVLERSKSTEYSPRFIKLLKTAELYKEAGEQQAKAFVGL
ncbi:trichohyalin [Drosophila teissieri]|uniref:trichohyalin n=1 Tax=Drosophila teissieri TaxID=7243 RepID=UPI001CBA473D|nr:trichohyalin [Drosophila teissieri]